MKNLKDGKKVFGLLTKISLLTLLVLTTCTCSGLRLTSDYQILENQIDYSIYSGKPAKRIQDRTVFVTLKIDALDFHSCRREKQLIQLRYLQTLDSAYYPNQGLMLKKCLRIKLYQFR